MAATLTQGNGVSRAIERDPVWLTFEVDSGTAVISAESLTLRALPKYTNILQAFVQCVEADVGGTSTLCSLAYDGNTLLTGSADNGGTINTVNDGLNSGTAFAPSVDGGEPTAGNLSAVVTTVGGSITNGAVWRILVLVNRNDF